MKRLSLPSSPVRAPAGRAAARVAREPIAPQGGPQERSRVVPSRVRTADAAASVTRAKAAAAAAEAADDGGPVDMDAFRIDLARRIQRFIADRNAAWRFCRLRGCRRHRACAAPHGVCAEAKPAPSLSPEEEANMRARVQRLIREHLAAQGIEP